MPFPEIDPIAIQLGPIAIRWYALAYIAGLFGGWGYLRFLAKRPPYPMTITQADDYLTWATLGVVLGGRLGYVLFYKPLYFLGSPWEIVMVWHGGMSFHGGLLGVAAATILYARRHGLRLLAVADALAVIAPIGLFFGRIANFVNGELFGRPAPDVPWAMVFPHGGPVPRHPSQLYEAALEGLVLAVLLHLLWRIPAVRLRPGTLTGTFLCGYAAARITVEFFREPDAYLGYLWGGATMGQLLSLPMAALGLALVLRGRRAAPQRG
ncbi:MAG: prolipoprotein diacylglyceryl transferase [Rhodospirillales bacterium]|nr:prolipoprotein diacylglyceryl transferase [Rhodospirillales bacterium]